MNKKPEWLRIPFAENPNRKLVEEILKKLNLNTVCHEANCPNYIECFSCKTATFMILGTNCTRDCRFCNVSNGPPQPVDPHEPEMIAQAVKELGLEYAVITSVTRDDLNDGGAEHFARVIRAIKKTSPTAAVEVLIPDLGGNVEALKIITDSLPDVISHNMETVAPLYQQVRPQAQYQRSLDVLENIKKLNPKIRSKTGIMLGLGEAEEEVFMLFDDLRSVGCELLTIGQYLAPSKEHFPIQEYIHPDQFEQYGEAARRKGFDFVASAPFVRSSYRAGDAIRTGRKL